MKMLKITTLALLLCSVVVVLLTTTLAAKAATINNPYLRSCSRADYEVVFGPCSNQTNTRGVTYKKVVSDAVCRGDATLNLGESASCTCSFSELVPIPATGADGAKCGSSQSTESNSGGADFAISGWQPADPNLCKAPSEPLMNTLRNSLTGNLPCPCRAQDIATTFSECVSGSHRRALSYFSADCDDSPFVGAVRLPRPVLSPCTIRCADGERVSPTTGLCEPCGPGTAGFRGVEFLPPYTATSGGEATDGSNPAVIDASNIAGIDTRCYRTGGAAASGASCPAGFGWRADKDTEGFLTSGDAGSTDQVVAEMAVEFPIVDYPAQLTFEYSVDSEIDADFFEVLDTTEDTVIMRVSGPEPSWRRHTYNFSQFFVNNPLLAEAACRWVLMAPQEGFAASAACAYPVELSPYDPDLFFSISDTPRRLINNSIGTDAYVSTDATGYYLFSLGVSTATDPCLNTSAAWNRDQSVIKNSRVLLLVPFDEQATTSTVKCSAKSIVARAISSGFGGVAFMAETQPVRADLAAFLENTGAVLTKIIWVPVSPAARRLFSAPWTPASSSSSLSILRHNVNAGINHRIIFRYAKDRTATVGGDFARVRNIRVTGAALAAPLCALCGPGTVAHQGASSCTVSPANTYMDHSGGSAGTACPPLTFSPPGSTSKQQCVAAANRKCTPADYHVEYGACKYPPGSTPSANFNGGNRNVSFSLVQPPQCNPQLAGSYQAPGAFTQPCDGCPWGQVLSPSLSTTERCESCPAGSRIFIDENDITRTSCIECPAGRAPAFSLHLSSLTHEFGPLSHDENCPNCFDRGWNLVVVEQSSDPAHQKPQDLVGSVAMVAGPQVPPSATATLDVTFTMAIDGDFSFVWFFEDETGGGQDGVDFTFQLFYLDPATHNTPTPVSEVYRLPAGSPSKGTAKSQFDIVFLSDAIRGGDGATYVARWSYTNKLSVADHVLVGISSLTINGVDAHVGTSCDPCPRGFYCPGHGEGAKPCPRGKFSGPGLTQCVPPIGDKTVAPYRASGQLIVCKDGSFPSSDRTHCVFIDKQGDWRSPGEIYTGPSRPLGSDLGLSQQSFIFGLSPALDNGIRVPANDKHGEFTLDLLNPQSPQINCLQTNQHFYSFGCIKSNSDPATDKQWRAMGPIAELAPRVLEGDAVGLRVTVSGTPCGRYGALAAKQFTVIIDMTCPSLPEPGNATSFDAPPQQNNNNNNNGDQCTIYISMMHSAACPVCSWNNLAHIDGTCTDGAARRTYAWADTLGRSHQTGTPCIQKTLTLPGSKQVPCPKVYEVETNTAWIVGATIAIIVVVLIVISYGIYQRHVELQNRYAALQGELGGAMSEVCDNNNVQQQNSSMTDGDDDGAVIMNDTAHSTTNLQQQQQSQQYNYDIGGGAGDSVRVRLPAAIKQQRGTYSPAAAAAAVSPISNNHNDRNGRHSPGPTVLVAPQLASSGGSPSNNSNNNGADVKDMDEFFHAEVRMNDALGGGK